MAIALVEGLVALIDEHYTDRDEPASYLDARAAQLKSQAVEVENLWRPEAVRRELDGHSLATPNVFSPMQAMNSTAP
jgi:hypothetical protein